MSQRAHEDGCDNPRNMGDCDCDSILTEKLLAWTPQVGRAEGMRLAEAVWGKTHVQLKFDTYSSDLYKPESAELFIIVIGQLQAQTRAMQACRKERSPMNHTPPVKPSPATQPIPSVAQRAYETFCKSTGSTVSWWHLDQKVRDAWAEVSESIGSKHCRWCGASTIV